MEWIQELISDLLCLAFERFLPKRSKMDNYHIRQNSRERCRRICGLFQEVLVYNIISSDVDLVQMENWLIFLILRGWRQGMVAPTKTGKDGVSCVPLFSLTPLGETEKD